MTRHYVRFLVMFSTAVFGSVLWIAAAQSPSQGPAIPTPTLYPVENISYTLAQVGGEDLTLTFDHAAANGITPGTTTVTSQYPRGMIFTLAPHSDNGDIQNVILYIQFPHGLGARTFAEYNTESKIWIAHLWTTGNGQPAWSHFDFYWGIHDTSGATLDTESEAVDYWDSGRIWFRMESDDIIVYWYSFCQDDPDLFAQTVANTEASIRLRREAGFGQTISYKPLAVIYASRSEWSEFSVSGIGNPLGQGYTTNALRIAVISADIRDLCIQNQYLSSLITHEVTHLYQIDVMDHDVTPYWLQEGQADWFSGSGRNYDSRLMNLASLSDIPSLTTDVSASTIQADGIGILRYHMGASFINWFVANYGIESHAAVMALMRDNASIYDAIETVTGEDFLDIENAWRIYLGYNPLTQADIDPASALQPALDPVANVDDTVTLPAVPATAMLYEEPGQNKPSNGVCFANTPVEILAVGSLDGVDYYQVNCMGQIGWMSRGELVGPGN
jgi:hypothetical protein